MTMTEPQTTIPYQRYTVEPRVATNSLGMAITIYHVVGRDGLTYAESRFKEAATLIADHLTARR